MLHLSFGNASFIEDSNELLFFYFLHLKKVTFDMAHEKLN